MSVSCWHFSSGKPEGTRKWQLNWKKKKKKKRSTEPSSLFSSHMDRGEMRRDWALATTESPSFTVVHWRSHQRREILELHITWFGFKLSTILACLQYHKYTVCHFNQIKLMHLFIKYILPLRTHAKILASSFNVQFYNGNYVTCWEKFPNRQTRPIPEILIDFLNCSSQHWHRSAFLLHFILLFIIIFFQSTCSNSYYLYIKTWINAKIKERAKIVR